MFFDQVGDGEPILAVHGLGGTSNFWGPVWRGHVDGKSFVAPDLPSAGRSENDDQLSIKSIADDLFSLLDALSIESAHLLGHSMGTIVCQHMAQQYPERVKSLALLGPLAEPPDAARSAIRDRAGLTREKGMQPIADAITDGALSSKTKKEDPIAVSFVREMLCAQNAEGYALSCEALADASAADVLAYDKPVLLITGDEDKVAPVGNVEVLASRFGETRAFTVLENCGHWTVCEKPVEVVDALQRFYASI
ncbi:MAG: alpha/beta hydrolase [Pseudomonadota bacterium]